MTKHRPITDEEWEYVKTHYGNESVEETANAIDRSYGSVRRMAFELGVTKKHKGAVRKNQFHIFDVSTVDVAYIAGFFDADGSVSSGLNKEGKPYFNVGIYNTNIDVLDWIADTIGGTIYRHKTRAGFNKLPFFQWRLTNRPDMRKFLNAVIPFLRIKRKKAKSVVTMILTTESNTP